MQVSSRFVKVQVPSVAQFVETLAWLFDLGTKQEGKITQARSYAGMQDRYAALDAQDSYLLANALAGISIYSSRDQPPSEVVIMLSRYLGHMQQLVSWFQNILVVRPISQESLNETLLKLFAAPQIGRLLLETHSQLPECSPLKQLEACIGSVRTHDYEPAKACKELIRSLLSEKLHDHTFAHLGIKKALNSIDNRSSKRPSTQRRELKDLDIELIALDLPDRNQFIDKLSGVYAAMMALMQLRKIMDKWQVNSFRKFINQLDRDIIAFRLRQVNLRHEKNSALLEDFYDLDSWSHVSRDSLKAVSNSNFQVLISLNSKLMCTEEPSELKSFLRTGLTKAVSLQELMTIQMQLEQFDQKPYYSAVSAFIQGLLALRNKQAEDAEDYFLKSLEACKEWPIGVFKNLSAVFCLGLILRRSHNLPPGSVNPILAVYLESLPQEVSFQLGDYFRGNIEKFNLSILISRYNEFCSFLCESPCSLYFNPLDKIEKHLGRIFGEIKRRDCPETESSLGEISFELTGKRERQRVKSYLAGTGLYDWLKIRNLVEVFLYFKDPKGQASIPHIMHYIGLPEPLQISITLGAHPLRDSINFSNHKDLAERLSDTSQDLEG
jgi:hypothetical protein